MGYIIAIAIQCAAYAVTLYRYRGYAVSPDGRYYAAMQAGERVPAPYSRRWLLPLIARLTRMRWEAFSAIAFLAVGPLVYELTGALWCVWLCAWLPGFATNVRYPVLVDQPAFALMLGAVVAYRGGDLAVAMALLGLSGQVKESAPFFGLALCLSWPMAFVALGSAIIAVLVGKYVSRSPDRDFMLHPFRVAMTKHDPLDWKEMVLPWGGVVVLGTAFVASGSYSTWNIGIVVASLIMGYGQLLMANDSVRLYQWAAPAVLMFIAPYQPVWMALVLVAHPFICGAVRRV